MDSTWTAVLAGLVAGLVIGAAQWLALRRIGVDTRWILATAGGLAVGLGLGFAIFGYGETVGDMWIVGAVSGLGIGIAQWPFSTVSSRGASRGSRRPLPHGRSGGR